MAHVSIIAFFCEDIREEKNDTNTLIGIFHDNIEVPAIPSAFPKLGLYARAHIGLDLRPNVTDLVLNLRFPDGTEQGFNTLSKDQVLTEMGKVKGGGTYVGLVMRAIAINFPIPAAGLIQIVARFAGEEYICGRMNVQLLGSSQQAEKKA